MDPEVASTLKSGHLSEWLHGVSGADHHHHDPYHMDKSGHRTYADGFKGYEGGPGFDHAGKADVNGGYGTFNKDYAPAGNFSGSYGMYGGSI